MAWQRMDCFQVQDEGDFQHSRTTLSVEYWRPDGHVWYILSHES
uniref:Uncharacterized protein n=1 Tax=Zea mays TaxID=4577 RepID=B4FEG0_MAIZE|nr:unknown [Zea mays]